ESQTQRQNLTGSPWSSRRMTCFVARNCTWRLSHYRGWTRALCQGVDRVGMRKRSVIHNPISAQIRAERSGHRLNPSRVGKSSGRGSHSMEGDRRRVQRTRVIRSSASGPNHEKQRRNRGGRRPPKSKRTSLKMRHIPGADMQKRNDILRDQQCSVSIPPPLESADQIREMIGRRWNVCILGSAEFKHPDAEAIVRHLATGLCSHLGRRLAFLTGGMPGVQATFAKHCSRDASIWNIVPKGVQSHYGRGEDVVAAADAAAKKVVFANVGDIYITIEGGPGVAEESRIAHQRGALIIPMIRTGGASSGMFDFPAAALTKPSWASVRKPQLLLSGCSLRTPSPTRNTSRCRNPEQL
ncbi:unnamed protein product, partial [Polarella glacialis]